MLSIFISYEDNNKRNDNNEKKNYILKEIPFLLSFYPSNSRSTIKTCSILVVAPCCARESTDE